MLATVTNKAPGPRGVPTLDREVVVLEAGVSALLDLVDHLVLKAWEASGEVTVAPLSEKEARAVRKRLDAEAEARAAGQGAALAALPSPPARPDPAAR